MRTLRERILDHAHCNDVREEEARQIAEGRQFIYKRADGTETNQYECERPYWDELAESWEAYAFPAVRLSHKLAASFACTSAAELDEESSLPPWPIFYVHVPTDLFFGKLGAVTGAMFVRQSTADYPSGSAIVFGMGEEGHATTSARSSSELCQDFDVKWSDDPAAVAQQGLQQGSNFHKMSPETARAAGCLRRLCLGIILELNTPKFQEVIAVGPPNRRPSKRRSDLPLTWDFKISKDVRVDVRSEVRSYCLGTKGSSPTVQVLVRGHYRRQAFGPGMGERKWIHIEPYWRGPEDAPIAVRSHAFYGDNG